RRLPPHLRPLLRSPDNSQSSAQLPGRSFTSISTFICPEIRPGASTKTSSKTLAGTSLVATAGGAVIPKSVDKLLDGVEYLARSYGSVTDHAAPKVPVAEALQALHSFTDIVRYLNTRRSKGARLELVDEASVQDTLFLMLRPLIGDLTPENPTDKVGGRYSLK